MIKEVQVETSKAVSSMDAGTKTTAEGAKIVEQAGMAFSQIAGVTAQTSKEVVVISDMMKVQKGEAQRAAKSVDGIASIAEETASAAEESASSTEELTASMEDMTARAQSLSEMAITLQRLASKFKISAASIELSQAPAQNKMQKKETVPMPKKGEGKLPSKVQQSLQKRGLGTGKVGSVQ